MSEEADPFSLEWAMETRLPRDGRYFMLPSGWSGVRHPTKEGTIFYQDHREPNPEKQYIIGTDPSRAPGDIGCTVVMEVDPENGSASLLYVKYSQREEVDAVVEGAIQDHRKL